MEVASPQHMSSIEKCGEVLFRLRDYTPIPLILISLWVAHPTVGTLIAGFTVAMTGEFIRLYGVAYIGTISRTRSYSNGELVNTGPYAVIRNPLYLGNLVLSLGLSLVPGEWWLPVLVLAFFWIQYVPIVAWEEMKLRKIFGDKYAQYCLQTPARFVPALSLWAPRHWWKKTDQWAAAWKSEKRTLTSVTLFFGVMIYLFFRTQG